MVIVITARDDLGYTHTPLFFAIMSAAGVPCRVCSIALEGEGGERERESRRWLKWRLNALISMVTVSANGDVVSV